MADDVNRTPDDENNIPAGTDTPEDDNNAPPPVDERPAAPSAESGGETRQPDEERMDERLERLGGEPAPVITPEEFARLQKAGQVHIDSRGRVRTSRRSDAEAGVSLRKRRAWYLS